MMTRLDALKNKRIMFVDFWEGFDYTKMMFYVVLKERYDITIVTDFSKAEYVFFSCFGNEHFNAPQNCIKIFYTAENISPDFNTCDYAIAFDWLEYGDRYLRLSNAYNNTQSETIISRIIARDLTSKDSDLYKRAFCSFVVSNSHAEETRTKLFHLISSYQKVDSGGRYLNNIGGPISDKYTFDSRHKFSICCENSSQPGYTTEKLYQAFAANTIPIYWGDPMVTRVFNRESFIFVNDYNSLGEVVEHVRKLNESPELYRSVLSKPIFVNADTSSFEHQMDLLKTFLFNIFDQNIVDAQRYNRHFTGFSYANKMREMLKKSNLSTKDLIALRLSEMANSVKRRITKLLNH